MLYVVLCTEGQMSRTDVALECKNGNWAPVLAYRLDGKLTIPCFEHEHLAYKFSKRNLPNKWAKGMVVLHEDRVQWVYDQGWQLSKFDWPNKLDVEFETAFIEFNELGVFGVERPK